MGVLAEAPLRKHKSETSPNLFVVLTVALYALLVGLAISRHEPWADEAQSWLLARDAGLAELWTRLLHYEGTPGLWQTVLHIWIGLGLSYGSLNVLSGLCGLAACALVMRSAPFPLAIRAALPFTFFLFYQYSVVARSYSLAPPLLFGAAVLYKNGMRHVTSLMAVLCLLAAISIHGMALSCSLWLAFHLELIRDRRAVTSADRRRVLIADACYFAVLLVLILAAWPAPDNMFVKRPYWSLQHVLEVAGKVLRGGFAGYWIASLAVIALSLPLLWRGRTLVLFLISLVSLSAINGVIYSQVWHYGLVFLAWLIAVWIAADLVRPGRAALASLVIVVCAQCYWTARSVAYDWDSAYSASREAAAYLKANGIVRSRLFAVGYACTGIQPYFPKNIFANIHGGGGPSYWDWSTRNHVNEDSEKLAARRPDYVIVGYKGTYEEDLWTRQIRQSGYLPVGHFEGNIFWETAVLEPESFDLYKRPAQ